MSAELYPIQSDGGRASQRAGFEAGECRTRIHMAILIHLPSVGSVVSESLSEQPTVT